jgi:putative MFS transporter
MIPAVTNVPDAAARLDCLPVSSFHRRTAALLAYVFFFELGDLNSFAYAAPALRREWHLSIGTIATITSASFLGMFVGAMTAGALSDRIGRKRALMVTTLWYSTMSLFNACAWSVPSLFAARLLTGVGLSGMTVVAMTYIGEMFPSRVRGSYQAHILMIGLVGIPATAYVARFLVPYSDWGWRGVFIWGSLALLFPLVARRLEESPRWLERRGRAMDAEVVLTRIEREVEHETGTLPPVQAPVAVVERRPGTSEGGTGDTGITALMRSGYGGRAVLLISLWLCQTLGFYGFTTLQYASAISIGAVPGAWIGSLIADRWERKRLIAIVAILVGTFGMIYGLSFNTWIIVIFGFLVAMSQQVFAPLLYSYTAECFPTTSRNTGAGLSYGIGRLGNVVGPLIVAFLFTMHGYRSVFAYIAACWLAVALLVTAFGPRMNTQTLA